MESLSTETLSTRSWKEGCDEGNSTREYLEPKCILHFRVIWRVQNLSPAMR